MVNDSAGKKQGKQKPEKRREHILNKRPEEIWWGV